MMCPHVGTRTILITSDILSFLGRGQGNLQECDAVFHPLTISGMPTLPLESLDKCEIRARNDFEPTHNSSQCMMSTCF